MLIASRNMKEATNKQLINIFVNYHLYIIALIFILIKGAYNYGNINQPGNTTR